MTKGGLAEKIIVSNGGSLCNNVHSLITFNDNSFELSDTGESYIKAYEPTAKQCSVVVGNRKGRRDGSKAQFSQPIGICFDYGTLFTVDTSQVPSAWQAVTSLEDYWKHLHLFGETIGLHTKTSTSVIMEIPQAIGKRLQQVYSFDKKCVDGVMSLIGTTAVTQGPQRTTVSSVVMEDERRILKSLRHIKASSF